jgi:hypothetical protein
MTEAIKLILLIATPIGMVTASIWLVMQLWVMWLILCIIAVVIGVINWVLNRIVEKEE